MCLSHLEDTKNVRRLTFLQYSICTFVTRKFTDFINSVFVYNTHYISHILMSISQDSILKPS